LVDIFHYPFPLYRLFFCPANRVWGHIIISPERLKFRLLNGMELSENIERMVR
jgi:hypothetical protein